MSRIVVGTDDPETSDVLAAYLAERLRDGDAVHAVTAIDEAHTTEAMREQRRAAAERIADRLQDVRVETTTVEREDRAAALRAVAADVGADEIVVGHRHRSEGERLLFGSAAQEMLEESVLPVVAVPIDAETPE